MTVMALSGISPPYFVAFAADAVMKPSHFSNCAAATKHLPPRMATHFGPADVEAGKLHATNQMNLNYHAPVAGRRQTDQEGCCTSKLHCSRPDSKPLSIKDILGLLGACCMHGFPVKGSFVDLRALENFSYYLVMLLHVLLQFISVGTSGACTQGHGGGACSWSHGSKGCTGGI